jgi:hypothetical protein
MRSSASPQRAIQLKLFHCVIKTPAWEQLPHEIRQQTVRLLARLLREQRKRALVCGSAKETGDD